MSEVEIHNTKQRRKTPYSEGVLLGFIPVVVYALGFSYESGYLSFYGIPSALISIDAPAMISAAVFGALYVFVLLLWMSLAVDSSQSESQIEKSIGLIMLYLGFLPIFYLLHLGSEYLMVVLFLSFGLIFILVVLRKAEEKLPWLQRMSVKVHGFLSDAFPQRTEPKGKPSAFGALQNGAAIFFLAMIPFLLVFAAGKNNAKDASSYDVYRNDEVGELAVIRIYGDKVIAIPFNRENKSFEEQFAVIEIGSLSKVIFTNEKVGPLTKQTGESANENPNK